MGGAATPSPMGPPLEQHLSSADGSELSSSHSPTGRCASPFAGHARRPVGWGLPWCMRAATPGSSSDRRAAVGRRLPPTTVTATLERSESAREAGLRRRDWAGGGRPGAGPRPSRRQRCPPRRPRRGVVAPVPGQSPRTGRRQAPRGQRGQRRQPRREHGPGPRCGQPGPARPSGHTTLPAGADSFTVPGIRSPIGLRAAVARNGRLVRGRWCLVAPRVGAAPGEVRAGVSG